MFSAKCKLLPRYKVVSWYKWQESKALCLIQILSLYSIFMTASNAFFWTITSASSFNTILFTIAMIGLAMWSFSLNSKIEIYALKDNIHIIKNGNSYAVIPLFGNDTIELSYKPSRFCELYKGTGQMDFIHNGEVISSLHVNSNRMVSYIANSLSQFINCHPDLVCKSGLIR